MIETTLDDTTLLRFPRLAAEARLVHAITTKPWNLASHRGPDAGRAIERRRRVCDWLGMSFDRLTCPAQVHGGEAVVITDDIVGAGRFGRDDAVPFVDGLVTDRPGVPIINLSADCVLVLSYDPVRRAVGSAHASWRGLVAGVAANLITQMRRSFACDPANIRAGIGPSAGPQRYRVREDVIRVLATRVEDPERYLVRDGGGVNLDLWRLANDQLVGAGVPSEAIETARLCTMSDARFFSHRRDGQETGRFALMCALA
jgi:YfiH family protein